MRYATVSPGTVVASVRSSTPSCHVEVCTAVAVAQPEAVWKSAGPDDPATPAVVCRTVPPKRWVVIWNGELRTTTVYPGAPAAAGTANMRVPPWSRKCVWRLGSANAAEPGEATFSVDAAPVGARVTVPTAPAASNGTVAIESARMRLGSIGSPDGSYTW